MFAFVCTVNYISHPFFFSPPGNSTTKSFSEIDLCLQSSQTQNHSIFTEVRLYPLYLNTLLLLSKSIQMIKTQIHFIVNVTS